MLLKLHKSLQLNDIIPKNPLEYIQISKMLDIEGQPIVSGSAYYTHGISILIHKIMEPRLKEISHIIKVTFSFVEGTEKDLEIGTWSC